MSEHINYGMDMVDSGVDSTASISQDMNSGSSQQATGNQDSNRSHAEDETVGYKMQKIHG